MRDAGSGMTPLMHAEAIYDEDDDLHKVCFALFVFVFTLLCCATP